MSAGVIACASVAPGATVANADFEKGEEFRKYIPVMLSVEPVPMVSGAPCEWCVGVWRKDGETWLIVVNAQDKASAAELALSEDFVSVAREFGPAAEKTGAHRLKVLLAPNEPAFYRIR